MWWCERKCPPKGMVILGGMALLELVSPFWRKCVPLGVNFEVSYAQDKLSESFLLVDSGLRCKIS